MSISDSGKGRIKHNTGGRLAARLLQALAENTVSEATEEGLVRLASGLLASYTTTTSSYIESRGEVSLKALIDAADGPEPLLNRHAGCQIFCIDFTGVSRVTYARAGWNEISLAPPKDGFLFSVVSLNLSNASLECLADTVDLPKGALMWGLAREHGILLDDDFLEKNPPLSNWKGESPSLQCILLTLSIYRY